MLGLILSRNHSMPSVLIVDSTNNSLDRLGATLVSAGIELSTMPCAISALEEMSSSPVELVIAYDSLEVIDVVEFLSLKNLNPLLKRTRSLVVSNSGRIKSECYKLSCDDFVTLPCEDSELLFRVHSLLRRGGGGQLQGSLSEISLVDVIQMLSAAQKTGVLEIRVEVNVAEMHFRDGQVIHAKYEDESGEEAFLSILRVARLSGDFIFQSNKQLSTSETIEKRTDHLLLGLASILDEESVEK